MSYLFEVSDHENDMSEVIKVVDMKPWGEYWYRKEVDDKTLYRVLFYDKRGALLFKTKFTAKLLIWDETDDQEIVTQEELIEKGYVEFSGRVPKDLTIEFEKWCDENKVAVVEEFKFLNQTWPYKVWALPSMEEEIKKWFVE